VTELLQPITRVQDLRVGDIGLGPIGGLVGFGVGAGQWALGEGWRLDKDHEVRIRHAVIVTESMHDEPPSGRWPTGVINKGSVVEAMPSGARERSIMLEDHWTDRWAWVRLPEDYPGQAADAAFVAQMMATLRHPVPYSPTSYLYLAQWRLGLDTARTLEWINRRQDPPTWHLPSGRRLAAGLPREAICSVLVDQSWTLTGKKIMHGVPYQCVTPKGLANTLRFNTPGAVWAFPGR
jgi:hypothetical protein